MYMTPTNIPGISLRLTPAMIDKGESVQPWQLLVDVPLKYDTFPEEVQRTILQALAVDGGVEGQERHVSALLDNIDAYFEKDGKGTTSADAQAYADHIRRDVHLLTFADNDRVSVKIFESH